MLKMVLCVMPGITITGQCVRCVLITRIVAQQRMAVPYVLTIPSEDLLI